MYIRSSHCRTIIRFDLDNVVLTLHIAGCSLDPYDRSYTMLLEDLTDSLRMRSLSGSITRILFKEIN